MKKVKKMLAAKKFLATSPPRGTKPCAPLLVFMREDYYRNPNVYFLKKKSNSLTSYRGPNFGKKNFVFENLPVFADYLPISHRQPIPILYSRIVLPSSNLATPKLFRPVK